MAGLWLAKLTGTAGFAKLVVVKRILPHLARSEHFTSMFLDEGRLAADLRHPNVLQVLEVGSHAGELFIAMELLEGLDVGEFANRMTAHGQRLPLGIAVQIVVDAAAGLAYAHQKRSLDEEPLEIVHRDVSPQNLFVTVDGHTKVVDFGIARARSQTVMTEAGTLKGKCAYMAPEYVSGEPVDHRIDQFALGVVLWELITAKRLFRRSNDVATLRAVLAHEVPRLASVIEGVPDELERVVQRTLALNPADRFPDCAALVDALDDFLDAHVDGVRMRRGPRAVARLLRERMRETPPTTGAVEEKTLPLRVSLGPSWTVGVSDDDVLEAVANSPARSLTLPAPSPLIARDEELQSILAALEEPGPVLLVGPKGVGKTHLARAVLEALRLAKRAPGGVHLVSLAHAETQGDVLREVFSSLGLSPGSIPQDPARAAAVAARALSARGNFAVVFDGVENKYPFVAPFLRELMPFAKVLVVSRVPLELMDARIVELGPLDVPKPDASRTELLASPCVRLLTATTERNAEMLSSEDLALLADAARRAGGLPSALLLAGQWIDEQSAAEPAARETLREEKQQALSALIEGGLHHLPDEEREWLLRLAPHRGPLDELLVSGLIHEHPAPHVLKRLGGYAAVVRGELAPLLREAALDELTRRDRLPAARLHHAAALARLARREVEQLDHASGEIAIAVMDALGRQQRALEDAVEHLLSHAELDDKNDARLLWLALALDAFVTRRGATSAHLRMLDEALGHASPRVDRRLRARALEARADHEKLAGRTGEARKHYRAALALTEDEPGIQSLLHRNLADLLVDEGDLATAESHARQAVAAARRANRPRHLARAAWSLARLAFKRGDVAEAEVLLERAGAALEASGDKRFSARVVFELGRCAEARGDAASARILFERAVMDHEAENDLVFACRARVHLGVVVAWLGNADDGLLHLRRARDDARVRGDLRAEATALGHIADVEAARGETAAAVRHRAEAAELHSS